MIMRDWVAGDVRICRIRRGGVRQDLAIGGHDVRSHHQRAPRPGGDLQACHATPSRRPASGTSVDSITLSDGQGQGGRSPSRRSGGKSQSADMSSEPHPNGRSVSPTYANTHCRITRAATTGGAHGGVGRTVRMAMAGERDNGPLSRPRPGRRPFKPFSTVIAINAHDFAVSCLSQSAE